MDGPGMSELYYGVQGYSDRVIGSGCGAIHGWSRDSLVYAQGIYRVHVNVAITIYGIHG